MTPSDGRKLVGLLQGMIKAERDRRGYVPSVRIASARVSTGGDADRKATGGPATYHTIYGFPLGATGVPAGAAGYDGNIAGPAVNYEWVSGPILKQKSFSAGDVGPDGKIEYSEDGDYT